MMSIETQVESSDHTGRVLVVGDAMLDSYKTCTSDRMSPEAPVAVLNFKSQVDRLGGAANAAAGVVAMGASCTLFAPIGDDAAGERLAQLLADAGVADKMVRCNDAATIVKERIIAQGQQICRIDYEEKNSESNSKRTMEAAEAELRSSDIVIFSDYAKGCSAFLSHLQAAVTKKNAKLLIDPKSSDFSRYASAFLVKPNWREFVAAAHFEASEISLDALRDKDLNVLRQVSHHVLSKYNIENLVVTMGSDGYFHADNMGNFVVHPTHAVDVFDLSGAGDTFLSTIAACLANGEDLSNSIMRGNEAAGVAVGRFGTSVISAEDLSGHKNNFASNARKIKRIHEFAKSGKRIVFTNGCFDILHAGHLTLLKKARILGDVLIVGVNSDASVSKLKGEGRPINSQEDRMALLGGLRSVDFVLIFEEETPEELIKQVKPDVLVKGGDYTQSTIVGADFVKSLGGKVEIVPLLPDRSTTAIIKRGNALD